ncbi:MAG: hypothetical protein H0T56_05985 [Pseudaminobacter sp.]|nr:hypothetical protein [Pseudaminobacter sp.]
MAILPNSIKRPVNLTPRNYVPASGRKHKLQDTDNWGLLATSVGMTPWDLVRYNFPLLPTDLQQAAREVNWYLQEYIGCSRLTPNNRNYRFSSSAGEIWLPVRPAAVPPTPNQIILATLREPVVARMNFGVGRMFIPSSQYEWVAKAIEGGYISVVENPALSGSAVYHYGANRIDVPAYGGLPSLGQRALIIHECTHAIFDLRKMTSPVEESEGMAYVAQALYSRLNGATGRHVVSPDPADIVSWMAWQVIFDASTAVAEIVARKYTASDDEASALYWAIKNANFYRARVGKSEMFDGVADAFYLAP